MKTAFRKTTAVLIVFLMIVSLLPVSAFANGETMTLSVSTVSGCPGDSVAVNITLQDNPGISSLKVDVHYDDTILTLTGVTFAAEFGAYVTAPEPYTNPQTISFVSPLQTVNQNGLFATLNFTIAETAGDGVNCQITVTYNEDDVFDGDFENIDLVINPGSIQVFHGIPGDINGDKAVNNKDAILLFRYIAGWSVTVDHGALDCNGDGKINNKDAITLFRYVAGWPNITIVRPGELCQHVLEEISAVPATCIESGSNAYWHCTACGKYFSDANATRVISLSETIIPALGHDWITVPGYAAQPGVPGLSDGVQCQRCGVWSTPQVEIPALPDQTHNIIFDLANGDSYLLVQVANGVLTNPNNTTFSESSETILRHPSVSGYRFQGWYDLPSGGNLITKIEQGTTHDVQLYAHWEKIVYTVQYRSSLYVDHVQDTYTVDQGLVLPTPTVYNYVFTGWADEQGKLYPYTTIPVGSTGNLILDANWTSERNKAWTKLVLDEPIIEEDEENNTLYFVYEIGEIQNVPLYVIKDFGYINEGGIERSECMTYKATVSTSVAENVSRAVAHATTESSNWTLSNGWNQSTDIDQEWCDEHGLTREEAIERGQNESSNWYVSTSKSGSTDTSHLETNQSNYQSTSKINASNSTTNSDKLNAGLKSSLGADAFGVKAEISASLEVEESNSNTHSSGLEIGGAESNTNISTNSTTYRSGWSDDSGYGASRESSLSESLSTAISDKITQKYNYGELYTTTYTSGESQGLESTYSDQEQWSNSVTYNTSEGMEITSSWTTKSAKSGYHRWIVAGTAHVFAIIGYDMSTNEFFVYTYTVMDDETHEFEDFSYVSASYNDQENGVIEFAIPFEVADYVSKRTAYSEGLKVNQNTGVITGYTGTDNCVVIPEYMNVGDGDVIKITGLAEGAFANNTTITAVVLSDFITEIPNNAFAGCSSLVGVVGGSITKIGSNVFAECTSMVDCAVRTKITYLGENAFSGVDRVIVNCQNSQIATAAAGCGAKKILLYLNYMSPDLMVGKTLEIPAGTEYIAIIGGGSTYTDLTIVSDANETVLNKTNLAGTGSIPLQTTSSNVTINQSSVSAPGIAVVLKAANTNLGLQGTITLSSVNGNALLCKNVSLFESNPNVVGRLVVLDKILVCGTIQNQEFISSAVYEFINQEMFENLLSSYTLYFDANGGTCNETSRVIANNTCIGPLPIPSRTQYSFLGWFLADGTQVTESTVFSSGLDVTVYAHWAPNAYTVSWNNKTGVSITVQRGSSPNAGAATGNLSSGAPVYYGDVLSVTYTAQTGYTVTSHGITGITVDRNITASDIYANVSVNSYAVNWSAGAGTTIVVNRTNSPLQNAATGNLSNGATVYYGDVLAITYTAQTGYTMTGHGVTGITVTRNITASDIYATASVNSFTASWSAGTGTTIVVKRTNSPLQHAATGTLSSGAVVYYGDVLSVTYGATEHYNLSTHGSESITVTGNVTSSTIYATATPKSYTYTIIYQSVNGTSLGSSSATYQYGTTNTITPPAKSGYTTPAAQTVAWDSANKTITFKYPVIPASNAAKTGTVSNSPKITYSATVEYQNRTATSVQLRVSWTSYIKAYSYTIYGQNFRANVGSVGTGNVVVTPFNTWSNSVSYDRSSTGTSGWITVPINTTNATTVSMGIYYWQTNSNGTDMYVYDGTPCVNTSWTINIPAY